MKEDDKRMMQLKKQVWHSQPLISNEKALIQHKLISNEKTLIQHKLISVVYYQPLKAESDAQRGKPKARCDVVVSTAPSAPVGKGKEMMSPGMYACRDIDQRNSH